MAAFTAFRWPVRQPNGCNTSCSAMARPGGASRSCTRSTKATAVIAPARAPSRSYDTAVVSPRSRISGLEYIFMGDAPDGAFDFDEGVVSQNMPSETEEAGPRHPAVLEPQGRLHANARYTAQLRGVSRRPVPEAKTSSQRGTVRARPVRIGQSTRRPRQADARDQAVMKNDEQAACCLAVQALAHLEFARQELSGSSGLLGPAARLEAWAAAAGLPSVDVLLQQISAGEAALRKLESANMGLIMKSVAKVKQTGIPREDLIFEAKAGLRKAAIRFDPSRGAPLFPLANMYIKKQLHALLEQQAKPIAAPVGGHEKLVKLKRLERELTKELGRPPTVELLAAQAGMKLAVVQGLLQWAMPVEDFNSLATIGKANEKSNLGAEEVMADVDEEGNVKDDAEDELIKEAASKQMRSDINLMMDLLQDERERQVVALRYGLADGCQRNFREIGEAMPTPISANLARTLFVKAMQHLRELHELMQPTCFA